MIQYPIAFMSKTLSGAQRNWSTIEKEAYAIFVALRQWEYMLQDRFFTLHTDHDNLRFLNQNTPKVIRWKLAVQEFNFQVEYIPGEKNVAADAFSRIIRGDDPDVTEHSIELPKLPPHDVARLPVEVPDSEIEEEEETLNHVSMHRVHANKHETAKRRKIAEQLEAVSSSMQHPQFQMAWEQGVPLRPVQHHEMEAENFEYHRVRPFIETCHNSYTGHHGMARTLRKLQTNGLYWPDMRRHVRRFVSTCPQCQLMSSIKEVIHTTPFTTSTYRPMSRINIDSIGPLPPDEYGNAYILVMIDCFSRFVELYPIKAVDANKTVPCLVDFVCRYGMPNYILSDKGKQFCNETIKGTLAALGVKHIQAMAYSKEENALVERANKEVMRHLRAIIHELRKESWSDGLPLVRRIMNASPNDTIGVSPARIIFGNSVELDRSAIINGREVDVSAESDNPAVKVWLDKALSMQSKIVRYAQKELLRKDVAHLTERETGKVTTFPVDTFVLLQYPSSLGGEHRPPSKIHMQWQGPFRVLEIKPGQKQYVLQDLVTLKESVHNVMDLKKFNWDSEFVNPTEVAVANQNEFFIETILDHRGDWRRVSSLEFLVRWAGYDVAMIYGYHGKKCV
jgi:transposase InsO family protein